MLNLLPSDYLDEYSKWIIITNILEGQDKREIWNNADAYNFYKNESIWRATKKIIYDISYLVKMTNYSLFKIYTPITKEKQMKQMNHKYLSDKKYTGDQLSYTDFVDNISMVIQSCTGTGKISAIAEHISRYIKNKP